MEFQLLSVPIFLLSFVLAEQTRIKVLAQNSLTRVCMRLVQVFSIIAVVVFSFSTELGAFTVIVSIVVFGFFCKNEWKAFLKKIEE